MPRDFKIGDKVATRSPLFHMGVDISNRLARVISTTGHIVIDIFDYPNNPVKCFRYELELLDSPLLEEDEVNDLLEDIEDVFNIP